MPEPTQCCIEKSEPVPTEIGQALQIPTPAGEDWTLFGVQVVDPESGPLTTFFIWVKE